MSQPITIVLTVRNNRHVSAVRHPSRFSLKPLGQLNTNIMWSFHGSGKRKNAHGHVTTVAAMPIFGKKTFKSLLL